MTGSTGFQTSSRVSGRGFDDVQRADVIIVGTGAAGLSVVDALDGHRVTVLSKGRIGRDGSSHHAQGGIAAALRPSDSPAAHALDTVRVGGGLSNPDTIRILTEEGPQRVLDLIDSGTAFDRDENGNLAYGLEAGHGVARILHAADATGAELMRALVGKVAHRNDVARHEGTFAYELAVQAGRVIGVLALDPEGRRILHLAPAVVLASGGIGQLFPFTTNPVGATGDGIAMAARAGALLTDLEFVQFHPTALAVSTNPRPLLTEALRGAGATLVDAVGRRFMLGRHPDAELAPRDVVARAVWRQVRSEKSAYLDARAIFRASADRFPTVARLAAENGLDPARDLLPVAPAAHYLMGGIWVDDLGRTSLPGLWACGECACTGAHGANRLASNSLLEALVFGRRVGVDIGHELTRGLSAPSALVGIDARGADPINPRPADELPGADRLRSEAFAGLGIQRDGEVLESARAYFTQALAAHADERSERTNLLLVGLAVAEAALARRESRGAHARDDYPTADPRFDEHFALRFRWLHDGPQASIGRLDAARLGAKVDLRPANDRSARSHTP